MTTHSACFILFHSRYLFVVNRIRAWMILQTGRRWIKPPIR